MKYIGRVTGILATLLFACIAADAEAEAQERPPDGDVYEWFPETPLFEPLIADPRWCHSYAAFRYTPDRHDRLIRRAAAVSFGEFFGIYGPKEGETDNWGLVGIQAAVFATFDMDTLSYDLINADYRVALSWDHARGPWSGELRLFHQSSHLGDEYILRRGLVFADRLNLSYEELDAKVSYREKEGEGVRLYGGAGWLAHTDPTGLKRWSAQAGAEYLFPKEFLGEHARWVAAGDFQWHQKSGGPIDVSLRAGVHFVNLKKGGQYTLLLAEYFRGHNPDGQFFREKIETWGLGLHVYF